MRKIILLFMLFISTTMFAQNLTFKDLLAIKKMEEIDSVKEFLFANSWETYANEKSMHNRYLIFTYNKKNKRVAFLHFIKNYVSGRNIVSFQIKNKVKMIEYIKQIEESGAKLIETSEDSFYYIFQDNTNTYEVKEVKEKELFLLRIS